MIGLGTEGSSAAGIDVSWWHNRKRGT
jgi:hypothetical protein